MVLDAVPDLQVVAEAEDGIEAVETALRHNVDLGALDVAMPRRTGLDATLLMAEAQRRRGLVPRRVLGPSRHTR
jgi:DNA-binding NarL/FixJ family response regulator